MRRSVVCRSVLVGLTLLLRVLSISAEEYKSYDGHAFVRATARDSEQLEAVKHIVKRDIDGVEVWKEPGSVGSNLDMLVSPKALGRVKRALASSPGLQHTIRENHVANLLAKQQKANQTRSTSSEFSLAEYHRYDQIMNWLDEKAKSCRNCQVIKFGESFEGRAMKLIKIGNDETKPIYWIDAGIHAREWIAPATAVCIIDRLLNPKNKDDRFLKRNFVFYIAPVLNPDGYEYTWTNDRMWRKNRSVNPDKSTTCKGADLNRNFGFKWGGLGASDNPCKNSYRGSRAFSEPEARAVRDQLKSLVSNHEVPIYLSLHSYGQYLLTSYGYSYTVPGNIKQLMSAAKQAAHEIKKVHGTTYQYGPAGIVLYPAAGGSDDYAKGALKINYSFTAEMRDKGTYGFMLPSDQIQPTCEEFMPGVTVIARHALRKGSRRRRRLRKRHRQ